MDVDVPELFFDAMPLWRAFTELSQSRQIGFDVGYIPYSEITNWLTENGIESLEERQWRRKFINFIDEVFIEMNNAQKKEKRTPVK